MSRPLATTTNVDRSELLEFIRPHHRAILATTRPDGRPQMSPVTMGVDREGRIVVASYPQRAKVANLRARPSVSVCVLSDDFNGQWIQVDGSGAVVDLPDALDPLVDYYRSIGGEHADWSEYRQAMVDQGKCLIRVKIERWGPIAQGGFPPPLASG
ncbi:PPOX class F420-dependent oxidoreductase [soil metagenome]